MAWNDRIAEKIYPNLEPLRRQVQGWQNSNNKVVFTNGCFDLIHRGHLDYLARAADLGDRLVIAVNTDHSVRELKGSDRPIMEEENRVWKLASLSFVDAVILFSEPTPIEVITALHPDILVKGGDYTIETVVGADLVQSQGGKVEIIPFLEGHSSSNIIEKIRRS